MHQRNKWPNELNQILLLRQLVEAFDLMPDILFWVKDSDSRFIYANQYFLEHVGVQTLAQIYHCNDFDFSEPHIARQFINDDQKVMRGNRVNDRLEMNCLKGQEVAWFITSKRPIINDTGEVVGSYGISRHLQKTSLTLSSMDALKVPVAFIKENYMQPITLTELAQTAHLSISALERRFTKHLGQTPKQFINEVRLESARRLLIETNESIANIAQETGFNDHSYFSRQFQRLFGKSPSQFRREHCTH
ncbi:helix-turn-helix domain-containing protein [Shewanella sp. 10N.286.45.A1]|uniref:AraC family transcriptional regulator n=1 Tax=Shewanella sp. 10N.286.45.A1 TaxID=3229694 RepID=UPI0035516B2F